MRQYTMSKTCQKSVEVLKLPSGKSPFTDWLNGLKDRITRARIRRRLDRLEQGHYGDYKALGEGVNELRLQFGSGYRIYFSEIGNVVVILLCGGNKSTQKNDVKIAKQYWLELKEKLNE
jgi:putative addiction module killer protein